MRKTNRWTEANHHFHLVIQSWTVISANKKQTTSEGISKKCGQLLLARDVEDVVDAGRDVVLAQFIPSF